MDEARKQRAVEAVTKYRGTLTSDERLAAFAVWFAEQEFGWKDARKPPLMNDPERLHKTVELYAAVQAASDDYDCAVSLLTPYKQSKNGSINTSVDSFLKAIQMTKEINADLVGLMESLNKATRAEDIDQQAIAKMLATVKGLQKDVRTMSMAAAKLSTFSVLVQGDEDTKPTAFSITAKQRQTLLSDVRELKTKEDSYVDLCADILLGTLTKPLRTLE